MSNLNKIIFDAKFGIPRQVLEVCFLGGIGRRNRYGQSIDWYIRKHVIYDKVYQDMNLSGAEELNIQMNKIDYEVLSQDDNRTVVRIPKIATQGRIITQALAYNYTYNNLQLNLNNAFQPNSFNMAQCGNSPLMNSASQIMRSAAPAPIMASAAVDLIAEHTILINDYMGSVGVGSMNVRVGFDAELNTLNPRCIPQIARWVAMALKAYIYNSTVIDLDQGELYGGAELGVIRNIIEGYADAYENYQDYQTEVADAVMYMNSDQKYGNYLRLLMSGQAR